MGKGLLKARKARAGFFLSWLVWLVLLFYQGVVFAGVTGKIVGKVKNSETGEPLFGANIILIGTTMGAATDLQGDYFVINVAPGVYAVKASMMGFVTENRTEVQVSVDRTITADFALKPTVVEGQAVTVVATREIVPMDISSSQVVATSAQVNSIPMINNISQYIGLQVGIEGDYIRGGGQDQTQFMVDGLMVVDNRANRPMTMVNLSSIQEISIIQGGFNAEYGNVRSGLINIVTKEGDKSRYTGGVDFRFSPARQKHYGNSVFDPNNFYLRSFLDPAVCYVGTAKGTWDQYTQNQYIKFQGWNDLAAAQVKAGRKVTPDDLRNLFMWRTRVKGSNALMPSNYKELTGRDSHERTYGDKPDWNIDASFSGPLPLVGKLLGNTSFFVSYKNNWEAFAFPVNRDYYKEENSLLKLTSNLSPTMKLSIEGLYGRIQTITMESGPENYYHNANELTNQFYADSWATPFSVFSHMFGLSFDHVLSKNTYYNVRITSLARKNFSNMIEDGGWRDTTKVVKFGDQWYEDEPYGFKYSTGLLRIENEQVYSGDFSGNMDHSSVSTLNAKFDLTSQMNKYNQVKAGIEANYDDIRQNYEEFSYFSPTWNWQRRSTNFPIRVGAYVQDKLEFEGMIANFGLRLDYNDPNTDWYTVDRYSELFSNAKTDFQKIAPKAPAKGKMKISPRLGVSHPISQDAKLYFNYGHFYSLPTSESMYRIQYEAPILGISSIGNPSANIPKTVAYELGLDYSIANFLIHIAGYYKDISDQESWVEYVNVDHSVDYTSVSNQNYEDIRGFEVRIDKRFGRWITGWANYNYLVGTSGYIGRNVYYQDFMDNLLYGLYNPYIVTPLARPYARANIVIQSPGEFGPRVAGFNPLGDIQLSLLGSWKAGRYVTYDPMLTLKLNQNLQWKDQYNLDLRISKMQRIGKMHFTLFADIQNVLNFKYLSSDGFWTSDATDEENYYRSLHLAMYNDPAYKAAGYIPGNDRPGDVKSKDKPYIDMPNRQFLWYRNLRYVIFGLKADF